MKSVNWLGVVVALIAGQVIGMLWYGMIFTQKWMELTGVTEAQAQTAPKWLMGLGVVNMVVVLLGLDWLIRKTGSLGWVAGAKLALAVCVLFDLTVVSLGYLYKLEPPALFVLDAGYQLLTYVVAGALIGGLRLKREAA
jgi:hypothetical protein